MAILWGSWKPNQTTNQRMRLGIELTYSPTTIAPETTSVTVRKRIYAQCRYRISDTNNTTNISGVAGAFSGSKNYNFDGNDDIITLHDSTEVVNLTYGAGQVKSGAASATGIEYIGSSTYCSVSGSITIPARPYTVPTAPSSAGHSRTSDAQNVISWTRNVSTAAPYSTIYIERSINGGAFVQIAAIPDTSSYVDGSCAADHAYKYRVRAGNSSGTSAYSNETPTTYNTPAPPGTPVAVRLSGTSIALAIENTSIVADVTKVERRVNGGAWSLVHTSTGKLTAWTDSTAPGGVIDYRAKNEKGALSSAYSSDSNDITTLQAPAAPTTLSPSGVVDRAAVTRLSYRHNSQDGSTQSARQVQYRINGGAWVDSGKVISTAEYLDVAADTFPAGSTVEWKVATWGAHADASPYSATASFTAEAKPSVSVTVPATDITVIEELPVTAEWVFSDRVGLAQAGYEVTLRMGSQTVLSVSENGTAGSITLPMDLPNNGSFELVVTVRSGSGLTGTTTRLFTTAYTPPMAPFIEAQVNPLDGSVTLHLDKGENRGVQVDEPDTAEIKLYRVDVDGSLVLIVAGVVGDVTVIDPVPQLNTEVTYRALALAASGAVEILDLPVTTDVGRAYFWNFGDGWMSFIRIVGNVSVNEKPASDQKLFSFAGRTFPVMFSGENRTENISVSGVLMEESDYTWLRALAKTGKRAIYRDPDGSTAVVRVKPSFSRSPSAPVRSVSIEMDVLDGTVGR